MTGSRAKNCPLNIAKAHSRLIASQRKYNSQWCSNIRVDHKIDGNEIGICNKADIHLGIQIDEMLNLKEHIKVVSAKISRAVGFSKYSK